MLSKIAWGNELWCQLKLFWTKLAKNMNWGAKKSLVGGWMDHLKAVSRIACSSSHAYLVILVIPNFLRLGICVCFSVFLDQKFVGSGQLGRLGTGSCPDGRVEHAQEPDHQTDDALSIELQIRVTKCQSFTFFFKQWMTENRTFKIRKCSKSRAQFWL